MKNRNFKNGFTSYLNREMLKEHSRTEGTHCDKCHEDKKSTKVCLDFESDFYLCDECIEELKERVS